MAPQADPDGEHDDGGTSPPFDAPAGTPTGLFVEVSDALHATLAGLSPAQWHAAALVGWTVRDVVAHLAAVHEVVLLRLDGRDRTPVSLELLNAANEDVIDALRRGTVDGTLARWHADVASLCRRAAVTDAPVRWLGIDVAPATLLVDRAFETWIHANDIRRAVGLPEEDPSDAHLRILCGLAIDLLPLALVLTGRPHDALVTMELTGPGGGVWAMPVGTGAAGGPEVHVRMPARDLCLLMGDRLDLPALQGEDDRDPRSAAVVRDLVLAAPVFARA